MGYAADVKALTADIAKLTAEINKMHTAVSLTGKDATSIFSSVRQSLGGGQKNLGSTGGNRMQSSLGTMPNIPQPTSMGGGNGAASMYGQMGRVGLVSAGLQATATIGSTLYNMAPDASGVVNRAGSYYQAALRSPGMGRTGLERATFSALRGGMTGVGSDAAVANILAGAGYVPGGVDYLAAARQTRGAATYLGMQNQNAASAIAGLQGGPMAANLYQYGITTMNMNGTSKSVGNISKQLYSLMFPKGATAKSVQEAIRSGYAGLNLQGMGMSADQQQMVTQAFIDIAAGKNPDLASAKSSKGNQNPFDPLFRMNTSSTMIQQASEKNTLTGLGAAAGTIETFNNSMKDVIASMALFKGYLDGLSGNPQGSALKKGGGQLLSLGKKALGFLGMTVGSGLIATGGGAIVGGTMVAGGAALAFGGGGTPGYGSSFGGRNMRSRGGANNLISAGYGAREAQGGNWDSTGGVHQGTDYAVDSGTPVVAVKDGVVSGATLSADYGQAVIIDHAEGYSSVYAHLSNKEVSPGTRILQGQEIGKSGKSGNATGPHLHYEVWHGPNNPVDPSELKGAGIPIGGSLAGVKQTMSISGGNPLAGVINGGDVLRGVTSGSGSAGAVNPNAGTAGDQEFAKALLTKAGIAINDSNVTALTTWMHWEGGTSNNAFNPLNTTLDMPGAGIFNSVGVKTYNSLQQGVDATYQTLTGKSADKRGYTAILDDLRAGAPLDQVVSHINSSSWGTKIHGGGTPGAPGIPNATPLEGMNTSTSAAITSAANGSKVVNFNIHLTDVSDAQALIWAKKIEAHLNNKHEVSSMGGK
jgi:murein DD-endopeptidase MepM/ murein hydrolase activator NlpD